MPDRCFSTPTSHEKAVHSRRCGCRAGIEGSGLEAGREEGRLRSSRMKPSPPSGEVRGRKAKQRAGALLFSGSGPPTTDRIRCKRRLQKMILSLRCKVRLHSGLFIPNMFLLFDRAPTMCDLDANWCDGLCESLERRQVDPTSL
jgi:hypothetical protein